MSNHDHYLRLFVLFASTVLNLTHGSLMNHQNEAPRGTITTIKTENGDVVDCVDIYRQPSLEHPLLKNHVLQMKPSNQPAIQPGDFMLSEIFQPRSCPEGTIPIRRSVSTGLPIIKKTGRITSLANVTHVYSTVVYNDPNAEIMKGMCGTINIWEPTVSNEEDVSAAQIYVTADNGSRMQTVEAGWQVNPRRTGDTKPRFFVYWTADGYGKTGCYDLDCPGFIQTNFTFSPGMAFQPSVYDGEQREVFLAIQQDKTSGNWWLNLGGIAIGYWPSALFTTLQDGAQMLRWGGEIIDSSASQGLNTSTQMGSGRLPSEGYKNASYVQNFRYMNKSRKVIELTKKDLRPIVTAPDCYNYTFEEVAELDSLLFFYGGCGCKENLAPTMVD